MCGCTPSSSTDAKATKAPVQANNEELISSQVFADDSLCTITELHISCENLADKDVLSKSDPFVVLYNKNKQKYYRCVTE